MNRLPPELQEKMRGVDYTQFLPMGRVAKYGNYGIKAARSALNPASINAGYRAVEAEMAAYRAQQAEMVRQARRAARELALKAQQKAQFSKIWPEGASEQLLKNFITGNKGWKPFK